MLSSLKSSLKKVVGLEPKPETLEEYKSKRVTFCENFHDTKDENKEEHFREEFEKIKGLDTFESNAKKNGEIFDHVSRGPRKWCYDFSKRGLAEKKHANKSQTTGSGGGCSVPLRCVIIMVLFILVIILFIYLMSPCDMNGGQPVMFAQRGWQTCS